MRTTFFLVAFILLANFIDAQTTEFETITDFSKLSKLKHNVITRQESSRDPLGGNSDGFDSGNFPYSIGDENVMLHVKGKGVLNRIWITGYELDDVLKFYFDGESSPSIEHTVSDFFSGNMGNLEAPLVLNETGSSGGFVCYIPFTFEESVMVTTSGNRFYNITYQLFNNDEVISTYTGTENYSDVITIFNNKGTNPYQGNDNHLDTVLDINSGGMADIATINNSHGKISELNINIPDITPNELTNQYIEDDGRAFTGSSSFKLKVNPTAGYTELIRRLDYGIGNQKAQVYVDGDFVGEWYNEGSNASERWKNSRFGIASSYTDGKDSITILIDYVSSDVDWNEFYYWIEADGVITDSLDVGNATDESNHNYTINNETWSGIVNFRYPLSVTDKGVAFTGYSEFTVSLNPDASEVKLVRRFDYCIADQKANVYIDGINAGEWYDEGYNCDNRWADSEFIIPQNLTAGKSQITVKVEFVSAAVDWNEFYYWILCDNQITDEINIGDTQSETDHNYITETQTWNGENNYTYGENNYFRLRNAEILENTILQISFDNQSAPSVNAPVGMFFGTGTMDAKKYKSLPIGLKDDGTFYCYLPMPFESNANIKLVNNTNTALSNITASVKYGSLDYPFDQVGILHTQYNVELPATQGEDITLLQTEGYGKYIGVVMQAQGGDDDMWLEGDERFYIDSSRTPNIYGTGTEDYFNGAWYFNKGPFDRAQHGFTAKMNNDRTLYRFHLTDPVYFLNNCKLGIEHGPVNDENINYKTLAFYYLLPETKMELTDILDLGDAISEAQHNYQFLGAYENQDNKTYKFEGDQDDVDITDSGYKIKGGSSFKVNINPSNSGVRLKRLFDYGLTVNQEAQIFVDDSLVGTWFTNGMNLTKRWREEFFLIPSGYTQGKDSINIKIQCDTDEFNWNEFKYMVYSVKEDCNPVNPMINNLSETERFCPDSNIVLNVESGNNESYQWYYNGGIMAGETNDTIQVYFSGDYFVKASGNCGTANSDTINLSEATPLFAGEIGNSQTVCEDEIPEALSTLQQATGEGQLLYQWQYSTDTITWTDITGETNESYAPPALGDLIQAPDTVYVRRLTVDDCNIDSSNTVYLNVKICTDIEQLEVTNVIISPNPAVSYFKFNIPAYKIIKGKLISKTGQVIVEFKNRNEINVEGLTPGLYFLNIETEDSVLVKKVVKL